MKFRIAQEMHPALPRGSNIAAGMASALLTNCVARFRFNRGENLRNYSERSARSNRYDSSASVQPVLA